MGESCEWVLLKIYKTFKITTSTDNYARKKMLNFCKASEKEENKFILAKGEVCDCCLGMRFHETPELLQFCKFYWIVIYCAWTVIRTEVDCIAFFSFFFKFQAAKQRKKQNGTNKKLE